MFVAIDFGISNTDLAVFNNGSVSFNSMPSQSARIDNKSIKNILKEHDINF